MKQTLQSPNRALTLVSVALVIMLLSAFLSVSTVSAAACTWTHRVRTGDTLGIIARQYQTTLTALRAINPQLTSANLIVEGTDICISETEEPPPLYGTTYTVKAGDSLSSIARQFGVTLGELARANGIGNVNLIVEGESLTVPEAPIVVVPAS
ncbi:MAG: LysM peptidoglycan-binding domain-containing protein [Chloroflexota bacterium]